MGHKRLRKNLTAHIMHCHDPGKHNHCPGETEPIRRKQPQRAGRQKLPIQRRTKNRHRKVQEISLRMIKISSKVIPCQQMIRTLQKIRITEKQLRSTVSRYPWTKGKHNKKRLYGSSVCRSFCRCFAYSRSKGICSQKTLKVSLIKTSLYIYKSRGTKRFVFVPRLLYFIFSQLTVVKSPKKL